MSGRIERKTEEELYRTPLYNLELQLIEISHGSCDPSSGEEREYLETLKEVIAVKRGRTGGKFTIPKGDKSTKEERRYPKLPSEQEFLKFDHEEIAEWAITNSDRLSRRELMRMVQIVKKAQAPDSHATDYYRDKILDIVRYRGYETERILGGIVSAVLGIAALVFYIYYADVRPRMLMSSQNSQNTNSVRYDDESEYDRRYLETMTGEREERYGSTASSTSRSGSAIGYAPREVGPGTEYCIKGNINAEGERIYHMPGDEYYDETVIDTSRGERWFRTPEEAEAAGWRHAYV